KTSPISAVTRGRRIAPARLFRRSARIDFVSLLLEPRIDPCRLIVRDRPRIGARDVRLGGWGGLILRHRPIESRIDPGRLSVRDCLGIGARNMRLGRWSSPPVRRSPTRNGFDTDGRDAAANDTDLLGGTGRKIDNETSPIGTPVVDLDDHSTAGVEV